MYERVEFEGEKTREGGRNKKEKEGGTEKKKREERGKGRERGVYICVKAEVRIYLYPYPERNFFFFASQKDCIAR